MSMKFCQRCGKAAESSMLICTGCGHKAFSPHRPATAHVQSGAPTPVVRAQVTTRVRLPPVPLTQARLLSKPVIAGLVACVVLVFAMLLAGGDKVADIAVNITPYSNDRLLAEGNEEVRQALKASLPADSLAAKQISAIGHRLVAAIPGGTPFEYRFHVLPDDTVNAFAVPGGDIFIHVGMIKLAGTEAQVAAVLAHEIQHVEQRHGMRAAYRSVGRLAMFSMVLGVFGDSTAGLLTRLSVLKHSRALESDADLRGLKLMYAAGLPRQAMVDMLASLADLGGGPPIWLSSHPDSAERARTMAQSPLP